MLLGGAEVKQVRQIHHLTFPRQARELVLSVDTCHITTYSRRRAYTPGHAQIVAYFLLIFQASVDLAGKEC